MERINKTCIGKEFSYNLYSARVNYYYTALHIINTHRRNSNNRRTRHALGANEESFTPEPSAGVLRGLQCVQRIAMQLSKSNNQNRKWRTPQGGGCGQMKHQRTLYRSAWLCNDSLSSNTKDSKYTKTRTLRPLQERLFTKWLHLANEDSNNLYCQTTDATISLQT